MTREAQFGLHDDLRQWRQVGASMSPSSSSSPSTLSSSPPSTRLWRKPGGAVGQLCFCGGSGFGVGGSQELGGLAGEVMMVVGVILMGVMMMGVMMMMMIITMMMNLVFGVGVSQGSGGQQERSQPDDNKDDEKHDHDDDHDDTLAFMLVYRYHYQLVYY